MTPSPGCTAFPPACPAPSTPPPPPRSSPPRPPGRTSSTMHAPRKQSPNSPETDRQPGRATTRAEALRWWQAGYQAGHQAAEHEQQATARWDHLVARHRPPHAADPRTKINTPLPPPTPPAPPPPPPPTKAPRRAPPPPPTTTTAPPPRP